MRYNELKKEVTRLSRERDYYRDLLAKRPIEIKAKAEIINPDNHQVITQVIHNKLNNNKRIYCKVLINKERLWCIPIGVLDKDEHENGEIFLGILDSSPINDELDFNDLIQFQGCDVIEIDE